MELSRQEYPALLSSLQPSQAVNVLDDRVKLIGHLSNDIVEWLTERRIVEDAYVRGLRRLAARRPGNPSNLGVFREPWHSIVGSCESYADSHETFARKIEHDVENPLREFTGKGKEISGITTIQGNLAALAKDVDEAQKKSNKLVAKGGKADSAKLSSALSGVQDAQSQWESQAPFVFEQLQALDENRINHLRDALTQLQTHEVDLLSRNRSVAEGTLNSVLIVDTIEEISQFVALTTQGAPSLATRRQSRHSTQLSTSSAAPPPATATSTGSAPPVPDIPSALAPPTSSSGLAPSGARDDARSEVSATASNEHRTSESRSGLPPTPHTEKKKSSFGGLRRLGTVMSRRKTDPKPPPGIGASPEKKPKSTRRNPLRRTSGSRNSMYQLNSPGGSATELADTSSNRQTRTAGPSRPGSAQQNNVDTNGNAREDAPATDPALSNGAATEEAPKERKPRPPSTIQEEGGEHQPNAAGPSSAVDDITRAEQEAAAMNDASQPQFKLDIKNEPIQEEGGDSAQAFSNVASTLRLGAQPTRRAGTLRGRRDVRNTVFIPNNASPESVIPAADAALAPFAPPPAARSPDDGRSADTQSIRSAHSLSSLSHGAVKHADMHAPGLNASIVETVSAWFTGGAVTKAVAIGEVALVHNTPSPNPASPASTTETIRLENFAVLEKVAPNPTFVTPIPDKSGEYTADIGALGRTQVAFKYQVHLEEVALASQAPVLLKPTWKVEATQTSVILNYSLNPLFVGSSGSVNLSNVVLAISLDASAGKATGCLSKPTGTFNKEKGLIFWRLGDLTLGGTDAPQRVLARFTTEGEAKAGGVEARWEISGDNATGLGSGLGLSHGGPAAKTAGETMGSTDPFADESLEKNEWKTCSVQRRIVSGKYVAN